MKITILCVGKLKEKYYLHAQDEYIKMTSRFARVQVVELADEPQARGVAAEEKAKEAEGRRILEKCPAGGFLIACDPRGSHFTSEEFSAEISAVMTEGKGPLCFAIGGSHGLSEEVRRRANLLLSFSKMTLPHRLFRIVLLEQIYRAFKIMNNETYHK